jgi:hypothetical protein
MNAMDNGAKMFVTGVAIMLAMLFGMAIYGYSNGLWGLWE